MLLCKTCELHYEVIWDNDGQEPPIDYCPRCGNETVIEEPTEPDPGEAGKDGA